MAFAFKTLWVICTAVWVVASLLALLDPGVQSAMAEVRVAGLPPFAVFLVMVAIPPLAVYLAGYLIGRAFRGPR